MSGALWLPCVQGGEDPDGELMLHVVEKKGDVWTVCDMKFEPDAIVFDWSTSPRLCPACYYGLFPVVPSRAESPPPPARGEDD